MDTRADGRLVQGQSAFASCNWRVVGAGDLHSAAVASIGSARRDFDAITLNIGTGHCSKLSGAHGGSLTIGTALLVGLLVIAWQAVASRKHVGGSRHGTARARLLDADERSAHLGVQLGCNLWGDVSAIEVFGALVWGDARRSNLLAALRRNGRSHILIHPQ